jgi:hypothetical protein
MFLGEARRSRGARNGEPKTGNGKPETRNL